MKERTENRHMVDVLFVLTLFFVFALSSLTLVILGANVYRSTVNHMSQNFTDRTTYAYITQKIRQSDETSSTISISEFGDSDCIVISTAVRDTLYNTYLYEYDGYLRELLCRADLDLDPSSGAKISELTDMVIENKSDGLYEITLTFPTEDIETMYININTNHSGGSIDE